MPAGAAGTGSYKKRYMIQGLEEDKAFEEVALLLGLRRHLNKNSYAIARYGFTEMLNNAVEHSHSRYCLISCQLSAGAFSFTVRDYGIGIFQSLARKFKLKDEMESVGELVKGKRTTMPERHTGEGVFFTSKAGDRIVFRSHAIRVIFDNIRKDIFAGQTRPIKGTEVTFSISGSAKRKLQDIFEQFAPEEFDYKFEKTRVHVRLFEKEYTSRSEARRLLAGLEKFREITLDFKGVTSIGQGFADEIFRVFARHHPKITIKVENAAPLLKSIISHVGVDNTT